MMDSTNNVAVVMAGCPDTHLSLYRRIQFTVHDPVALIELDAGSRKVLILRDIEMERARQFARVTDVHCPPDFAPPEGLSGDRATATAQATAECLRRNDVKVVRGDRLLPLVYVDAIRRAGIEVEYDSDLGVTDRRQKTEEEVEHLREAQRVTEEAVAMVCQTIARSEANADGELVSHGQILSSEFLRSEVEKFLLEKGYGGSPAIIAGGPGAADCHWLGYGPIKTSEPVIVDIFPKNQSTHYCGDCTRTVVHGDVPDEVVRMHAAVADAKAEAIAATKAGATGESVHQATEETLTSHGYQVGLPKEGDSDSYCAMTCGTGHGIGLEVHEPPLLDYKGPELLVGDALTVEPGLYCRAIGAIRLEDMVIVRESGSENLNTLPKGLDWK